MSLMFKSKSDFGRKDSETGNLSQLHGQDRIYGYFSLFAELSPYLKFAILLSFYF
jgi:hypothetical protein